ncbi:aspartic proteinase-like protein 2 [Camellia sinensis]|uniref:aspartic proteinase-like protein 2 n=1 Tax=Camellia sinensis TaxID=4442 RepID=UPI001036832F|nr:aspartic proteinase-like protein 2 [Camellia sinensis]XP_028108443.1 aspartic proteinase-like protein 2 [Camellia sinensis]
MKSWAHYNVILKSIEVGDSVLQLPSDGFDTDSGKLMIMDSGTTLAYLGDELFNPLMKKILAAQPNLKLLRFQQQFTCFKFSGSACTTSTCSFDWTKCKSIGSFPPGPAKHGFECCWCRHAGFSSQQSADISRVAVCFLWNAGV